MRFFFFYFLKELCAVKIHKYFLTKARALTWTIAASEGSGRSNPMQISKSYTREASEQSCLRNNMWVYMDKGETVVYHRCRNTITSETTLT